MASSMQRNKVTMGTRRRAQSSSAANKVPEVTVTSSPDVVPVLSSPSSSAGSAATSDADRDATLRELREAHTKLRASFEAEEAKVKALRRERAVEVREVTEREQNKASIALKDLRLKLMQERSAELDRLKEAMNRKHEADAAKMARQREAEVNKLRDALAKCQSRLKKANEQGLSGADPQHHQSKARGGSSATGNSFEGGAERAKQLTRELNELRAQKKTLEASLRAAENQRRLDLARATQGHAADVARVKRESETEVRKLVEDIKSRERQMAQLERDLQTQTAETSRMRTERQNLQQALKDATDKNRKQAATANSTSTGNINPSSRLADGSDALDNPPGDSGGGHHADRSEAVLRRQMADMTSQIQRLEEQCGCLKQEKADLVRKVAEVERRQRPLTERARRFLEKNVELTANNRQLEEKIKQLNEDAEKLKEEMVRDQQKAQELNKTLDEQKAEQSELLGLKKEMENLREQLSQSEITIEALKLACSEKDRRIELICHRRRKQRAVKAQQKVRHIS